MALRYPPDVVCYSATRFATQAQASAQVRPDIARGVQRSIVGCTRPLIRSTNAAESCEPLCGDATLVISTCQFGVYPTLRLPGAPYP